jgi:hypothetical protein
MSTPCTPEADFRLDNDLNVTEKYQFALLNLGGHCDHSRVDLTDWFADSRSNHRFRVRRIIVNKKLRGRLLLPKGTKQ